MSVPTTDEQNVLRFISLASALMSMGGATAVIVSALRFRELTKRFFAIRLIFFLALTNLAAALFFIVHAVVALEGLESGALLCEARAMGKFYFSAASIMWTSCFAFTLYRDLAPSYRRHALRKYEVYFHLICWPVPAVLAVALASFTPTEDANLWCKSGLEYTRRYLLCFYVPLLLAFTFNLITYGAIFSHSQERQASRITSLYLLAFALVWLPSIVSRLQVLSSPSRQPIFALMAADALCTPLQGALNGVVYGWTLPHLRNVYRTMLLGTDGLDALKFSADEGAETGGPSMSGYTPPTS